MQHRHTPNKDTTITQYGVNWNDKNKICNMSTKQKQHTYNYRRRY